MRYVFPILLFFLPFFVEALIITEVQIEGERADDCYIKIYNLSGQHKNIGGYSIRKKTSTGTDSSVRLIPSETIIEGHGYVVWASSRNSDFPEKIGADLQSTQYLSKNNSVAVFDNDGKKVDALGWGEGENQYKEGNIFPRNPEKGQIIKRVKEDKTYKNTEDNASDFQLDPSTVSPIKIEKIHTEKQEETDKNPILVAVFSSIALGLLILTLKRWQDTVTSKI